MRILQFCLIFVPHIILFLLIAGEDADLRDVGLKEATKDCVTETASPSGNHEYPVFED